MRSRTHRWLTEQTPFRRTASVVTSLSAIVGMGLMAGPAATAALPGACLLPRTDAHHSVGNDSWNSAYPRPNGELDALMLFLSYPDWKPVLTPSVLVADHFPATTNFFSRASYGEFRLRVHPHKKWIEMPAASTSYGIQRDWDPQLRATFLSDAMAAAEPVVDFGAYDLVYLVSDPHAPGVNSDATKVVNFEEPMEVDDTELRRVVTVFEQHPPDRYVLAHETGHIFDLPDLYHRPEEGKRDWDTYVGDWGVMGSQFGLAPDPFGWHKWKLGWLEKWHIDCVPVGRGGTTVHTLRALGAPLGEKGQPDTRLIVIRTGTFEAVALEIRAPVGNDVAVCGGGVLLYRIRSDTESAEGPLRVIDGHPKTSACPDSSVYPPLADAPLRRGETFLGQVSGGIRVHVAEKRAADGGWTVRVTR